MRISRLANFVFMTAAFAFGCERLKTLNPKHRERPESNEQSKTTIPEPLSSRAISPSPESQTAQSKSEELEGKITNMDFTIVYAEPEPKILAEAAFFSGDDFNELKLDAGSTISVNGTPLSLKPKDSNPDAPVDYRYRAEFESELEKPYEFVFQHGDIRTVNKISIPSAIKMIQPTTTDKISRWKDLVIKWEGNAPKDGESILATVYIRKPADHASQKDFEIILQQSITSNSSIVFKSEKLQKLKSGQMEISLNRSTEVKTSDLRLTGIYGAKSITVPFD